jgi:tetratricopeptide (TPR) repeat protein
MKNTGKDPRGVESREKREKIGS